MAAAARFLTVASADKSRGGGGHMSFVESISRKNSRLSDNSELDISLLRILKRSAETDVQIFNSCLCSCAPWFALRRVARLGHANQLLGNAHGRSSPEQSGWS